MLGEIREQQRLTLLGRCVQHTHTHTRTHVHTHAQLHTSPATPPPQLLDTLGAGDTFNAGFIHKLSSGHTVQEALSFACQLAGAKCGLSGFDGLTSFRNT